MTPSNRRRVLQAAGAAATLALPLRGFPQGLPFDQPKFFYGFPAGSAGDIARRRVADLVANSAYAKGAALVENKPGTSPAPAAASRWTR